MAGLDCVWCDCDRWLFAVPTIRRVQRAAREVEKVAKMKSRSLVYELFEEDLRECLDKRSNVGMNGSDER